jgi:hypothetical protein
MSVHDRYVDEAALAIRCFAAGTERWACKTAQTTEAKYLTIGAWP